MHIQKYHRLLLFFCKIVIDCKSMITSRSTRNSPAKWKKKKWEVEDSRWFQTKLHAVLRNDDDLKADDLDDWNRRCDTTSAITKLSDCEGYIYIYLNFSLFLFLSETVAFQDFTKTTGFSRFHFPLLKSANVILNNSMMIPVRGFALQC